MTPTHRRVAIRTLATALAAAVLVPLAAAGAQQRAPLHYPPTRTVDTVADFYGTRIADPYRWLESIDSADVGAWVKTQNAVTMPYLAALPGRDALRQRITALFNFRRTGVPFWQGGRWFYTRN